MAVHLNDDEQTARRARLQAGAEPDLVRLLQLRDLLLDHLDPRRLLHDLRLGWNNGGPVAIAWGWPIISAFILIIGFCMSELVSAYPTSGGIYWWASKLGGAKAGYYTGWLNLIGLLADRSRRWPTAARRSSTSPSAPSASHWAAGYSLQRVFIDVPRRARARRPCVNIFSSHLLAMLNNVSVWWHVVGAAIIIAILWSSCPDEPHERRATCSPMRVNNTAGSSAVRPAAPGFLVLRPAARLPADAVHDHRLRRLRPPVRGDPGARPTARPRASGSSIFYSAIGGWILLLAFLFAVQDADGVTAGGGGVAVDLRPGAAAETWAGDRCCSSRPSASSSARPPA